MQIARLIQLFTMSLIAVIFFLPVGSTSASNVAYNPPEYYQLPDTPIKMLKADMNGDGNLDLVVLTHYYILIYFGNSNGTFTKPFAVVCNTKSYSHTDDMVIGDLNEDGLPDVVVLRGYDNCEADVFLNLGGGYLSLTSENSCGSFTYSTSLAINDFNGDKHLDLVAMGSQYAGVSVLLGNGNGTFQPAFTQKGFDGKGKPLASADFNGDGVADLVYPFFNPTAWFLATGIGNGTFHSEVNFPIATDPNSGVEEAKYLAAPGDLNGDGKQDVIYTTSPSHLGVVAFGDGNGGFPTSAILNPGQGLIAYCIAAGDFNGDGTKDIVTSGSTMQIFLGQGNAQFAAPIQFLPNGGPYTQIVAGDFDHDGKDDIAIASAQGAASVIAVYRSRFPGWTSVPISKMANLAAGARTGAAHPTQPLYFYKGTDSRAWAAYFNGTDWTQSALGPEANVADWIAFNPGFGVLCYQGTDAQLWCSYPASNGWNSARLTNAANVAGDIAIDTQWNTIAYRGTDDKVWLALFAGTHWIQATLGGSANVAGDLSVDSVSHRIFYRGTDGNIWVYYLAGSAWQQAKLTSNANVVGAVRADGPGFVFYKAGNNTIWCVYSTGYGWQQSQLDGNAAVGTDASVFATTLMLYLGTDARCHYLTYGSGGWSDSLLGDGGANLAGGLDLVKPYGDVFVRRFDGNLVLFYYYH